MSELVKVDLAEEGNRVEDQNVTWRSVTDALLEIARQRIPADKIRQKECLSANT